ncbi:L,D-transpeptidase [Schaalia vaccimaxillae]|uniref:L,D-transpeptidase n=1 Tax=Schaalia vaccimaxillae TaxID=183916 RepID=UPI0003B6A090|nr:L,D-transpeptidase [Schaalia vaccimaxillae]
MLKTLSSKVKWAIGAAVALVLLVVGSMAAYAVNYKDKALPGVSVAGTSVQGMTRDQVEAHINDRVAQTVVTVSLNEQSVETTLAEGGVSVDADATADEVFKANKSFGSQISAIFSKNSVEPVLLHDNEALEAFTDKVNEAAGSDVKDAAVSPSEDGASFVATQAVTGSGASREAVAKVLQGAAQSLASAAVTIEAEEISPTVTTENAKAVADRANALVALDVVISDGIEEFTASAADKASWVSISQADDGTLADPSFDSTKITEWVKKTAAASNVEATKGINNVNSEGKVLSVAKEGVSGWSVNNADKVAEAVVAALTSGQSFTGDFDYDEVKPEYEERRVAEGSENLVYQAGEGEKWIDLNLSSNTVTAYEGGKAVGGPFYMVPGAPETPTVTGTYHVYLKYQKQTMRGLNVDGSKYVTPDVPWVSYFTGSYAFHGAPWRSSFGWSGPGGSHGCVNMQVDAAKFIYDWSEMGTVVVSHY